MSWFGGKKSDGKAEMKEAKSGLRQGKREIDKEVRHLETAEAKCQDEIRKYAKDGNQVWRGLLSVCVPVLARVTCVLAVMLGFRGGCSQACG